MVLKGKGEVSGSLNYIILICFKGIPEGSVVSVSTIGVKENKQALQVWRDGMAEMMKQINPSAVIVYGGKLDFDFGEAKTVYFENKVTENWQ